MSSSLLRLLAVLVVLGAAAFFVADAFLGSSAESPVAPAAEPATTTDGPPAAGPVEAAAPEIARREQPAAPERVREEPSIGEIELAKGTGGLSGVVLTGQGKGVEDAEVTLKVGPAGLPFSLPTARKSTGRSVKTSKDGTYHLGDLPPGTSYVIEVDKEAYARAEVAGLSVREDDMTVVPDIILGEGPRVYGLVRGAATPGGVGGNPIAGATVELWDSLHANFMKVGEKHPWKVTETDASGAYEFRNVHFNALEVVVSAPGYATASRNNTTIFTQAADRELNFDLSGAVAISGMVLDPRGIGIENATVDAFQIGQPQDAGASKGKAFTGKDGTFTLTGLAEGNYNMNVSAVGYSDKSQPNVASGSTGVRIPLEPRGAVAGIVQDAATGQPMARFKLQLKMQRGDGQATPTGKTQAVSSGDGSFLFEDIDPNQYVMEAEAPGYAPCSSEPFSVRRGDITQGVTILMDKGGTITGVVVKASGEPVAGARVRLNPNKFVDNPIIKIFSSLGPPQREVTSSTDESGRFLLELVVPGTYQLEVAKGGFAQRAMNDVTVARMQVQDVGRVVLSQGGRVSGRCVTADGRAFSDGTVHCTGKETQVMQQGRPDYDGRFEFTNLPPGEYKLTLNPDRMDGNEINPLLKIVYATKTEQSVQVAEGSATNVTLTLPPPQGP